MVNSSIQLHSYFIPKSHSFKWLFLVLLFFTIKNATAQNPCNWTFNMEQQSATEATLVFKAAIADHWHMYSQFTPEGGSLPLEFIFEKNNGYTLIGKTSEYPKPLVKFSDVFGVDEWIFEHAVTFKQKVKLNGAKEIKGNIYYQVCKEACINGDTNFVFKFENNSLPKNLDTAKVILDTATIAPTIDTTASIQANVPADCIQAEVALAQESNGAIFAKGFLGGLVALLTPCVFSMIPLTVSFFIKRSGNKKKGIRNASLYSSFIVGIFIALGFVMSKVFGADALNAAASDIYVNLAFFIIFLIFAASFFGAFELTLPTSWINKADAASDRGGILGIFFMALTLVLVSFSCTAPVIGGLLALVSQGGNNLGALIGMAGFAIALALPFTLFALFPAWLNSLPKSGGWMNVIKVSLGFVELALALKFLSNVDMAYKWEFLHRELFIALWIIIFGLWGWYLLGKLKFAHDDDTTHLGVGRLLSAVLVLAFTIYLVPGLWGSPLKLISGFPPPDFYKEWKTSTSECPHDLNCFHDYEEGMTYAKQQGKPVLLDFTGWSCVNCRQMEERVWPNPKVMKFIREEYILISLYVDDKTPLEKPYTSSVTGKEIKTIGKKWSEMQVAKYNNQSQPWYVLIDHEEKLLNQPRGNTPNADTFAEYLKCGLTTYKTRSKQKN